MRLDRSFPSSTSLNHRTAFVSNIRQLTLVLSHLFVIKFHKPSKAIPSISLGIFPPPEDENGMLINVLFSPRRHTAVKGHVFFFYSLLLGFCCQVLYGCLGLRYRAFIFINWMHKTSTKSKAHKSSLRPRSLSSFFLNIFSVLFGGRLPYRPERWRGT